MISLALHHAAYSLLHTNGVDGATEGHLDCFYLLSLLLSCIVECVSAFLRAVVTHHHDVVVVELKVNSKTVAQCVEFYYTYKKQVKIGRNGTLLYGEAELPETRPTEEEVDYKVSLCVYTCVC